MTQITLSRSEVFAILQADELQLGATLEYPAGSRLITECRATRRFFAIMTGTLTVEVHGEYVATLSPGDWCGEIGLLRRLDANDGRATATVTASTDVRLLAFEPWEFKQLLDSSDATRGLLHRRAQHRVGRRSALA